MAKQGAKTVTPKLRFPEFLDVGDWNRVPLGRLFSQRTESGFIDLPLLSLMDKEGIVPQEESNRKDNSNADKSKYLRVVPGDIAYNTMRMWEGRSAYVGIEGLISPAYTVCAPVGETNGRFFSYYFKTGLLIGQFRKYSQGLVKDTLNLKYENFQRIEIAYPPDRHEQHRIADCLTSLDEVIAAQVRKVESLKAHKRGLMQQLFPREGETRPRLRFPEFRNAPEWKDIAIGDIGDVITGSTPSTTRQDFYGGNRLFVSPADISDTRFVESTKTTLSDAGFTQARSIKAGSVLFVCIGSTIGKVAQNMYECATNQQINAIEPKTGFNADFVFYALELASKDIAELAGRQAVPIINKSQFSAVRLRVTGPAEQQRIADCLTSLDTRITAEASRFAALKTHKQGLMQQLFPAPEAATA